MKLGLKPFIDLKTSTISVCKFWIWILSVFVRFNSSSCDKEKFENTTCRARLCTLSIKVLDALEENIQIKGQYLKWHRMKVLQSVRALSRFRKFLIRWRAVVFLLTVEHIFSTCELKFNFSSKIIPNNKTDSFACTLIFWHLIDILELSIFLPRSIIWNFAGLATRQLDSNHEIRIAKSFCSFLSTTDIVSPELSIVLSSAKLQISHCSTNSIMSLIKTLKSNGPNMEPWGTPESISSHSLKIDPILTRCLRFFR